MLEVDRVGFEHLRIGLSLLLTSCALHLKVGSISQKDLLGAEDLDLVLHGNYGRVVSICNIIPLLFFINIAVVFVFKANGFAAVDLISLIYIVSELRWDVLLHLATILIIFSLIAIACHLLFTVFVPFHIKKNKLFINSYKLTL